MGEAAAGAGEVGDGPSCGRDSLQFDIGCGCNILGGVGMLDGHKGKGESSCLSPDAVIS